MYALCILSYIKSYSLNITDYYRYVELDIMKYIMQHCCWSYMNTQFCKIQYIYGHNLGHNPYATENLYMYSHNVIRMYHGILSVVCVYANDT